MARFGSNCAFTLETDGISRQCPAGTTYADTQANALEGDVVWDGMSSQTMSPGLIPLDASAQAMKNASQFVGLSYARPDGCNSIDG